MTSVARWLVAVGLCVGSVGAWAAPRPAPQIRSAGDGVYSAVQARRGESLFDKHCGSCHEPARFTGSQFVDAWQGPLDGIFRSVKTTMPEDNPGGLPPQDYADIIAYWLHLNGYPAGTDRLEGTLDAMRVVNLEPPVAPGAESARRQ